MALVFDRVPASKQIQQVPPAIQQRPMENAAPQSSNVSPGRMGAMTNNLKRPAPPPTSMLPMHHGHQYHHQQHQHHASAEQGKRQRLDLVEMPSQAVAKIQVSSAQAGIVIGQKGSTIQQIRALSGARVNIDSHDEAQAKADPAKRDVREMTCVGSIEQVEAALNLLRQCFQTDNLIASAGKGQAKPQPQHNHRQPPPHVPPPTAQPPPPMGPSPGHGPGISPPSAYHHSPY